MTTRHCAGVGVVLIALALSVSPAIAQPQRSLCADCHFANLGGPSPRHLAGEAFAVLVTNKGLDSPVNPRSLPRTCGACHAGPFVAFQASRHYSVLREGDADAPTCSTCHGEVAANLLSPKALESQCNGCHGRGQKHARPEYAANARILLTEVRSTRAMLDHVKPLIARVKDTTLRTALQYDYDQAQVPLREVVHAAHAFVFEHIEDRLGVARDRADALSDRLANLGVKPSTPN